MDRTTFLGLMASIAVPSATLIARKITLTEEYLGTSSTQRRHISNVYKKGKVFGLGKTLVVTSWKESSFGIQLDSTSGESSGGPFGLSYYHTAVRHFELLKDNGIRVWIINPTLSQLAYVENRLKTDLDFSVKHIVTHINRGIKEFGNDWIKVWAFINGGYENYDSYSSKKYAEDFLNKIRIIRAVGILKV